MSSVGKKNSILTDIDMQQLFEAVMQIAENRQQNQSIMPEPESYYIDYHEQPRYPDQIFPYDIQNAKEFARMLEAMWDFQEKTDVRSLLPVCAACMYKYLIVSEQDDEKNEISPFIYEF